MRNGTFVFRDVWLVSASNGLVTSVPPVTLSRHAGRVDYSFLLCLPPALPVAFNSTASASTAFETYHLRLFLVKGGVNSSAMADFRKNVFITFDSSPVKFEADVRVPREQPVGPDAPLSATEWPLASGFNAPLSHQRRRCTARDVSSIGEGWITAHGPHDPNLPWMSARYGWHASSCDFPRPNSTALRQVLTGHWLAFVGDSSMQEQVRIAVYTLGLEMNETMEFESGRQCHLYRMVDTGMAYPGLEGIRISHFWAGGPKVCSAWEGVKSYDVEAFRENLEQRLTLGGRPDVLVFNSGLHDLQTPLARYVAGLDTIFTLLRRIVGPACLLVWKSTLAAHMDTMAVFEDFNAAGLEALQRHAADGPVALLDQYALTIHKFVLGAASPNANHCGDAFPMDSGCVFTSTAISLLLDAGS